MLVLSSGSSLIYRFEDFELDPGRFELREHGQPKHVEPQVLSLLILLAANADRMVSKDEMVEKVWGGRFISDATLATRIKAARQALGDDGKQQRFIRTIHGRGLRFVPPVSFRQPASAAPEGPPAPAAAPDQPSIAVLPFRLVGRSGALSFVADALADELIGDLSRLRWLMVIARASSFRFRGRDVACHEVGEALNVRYCLGGTLDDAGDRVTLSVELSRTADSVVVWSERFEAGRAELQQMRAEILKSVVARIETHIVRNEVDLARQMPEASLDAWSAYHLGLDLMFRFNKSDNAGAGRLFERAIALDPNFSRAYSGLSFTSFQDNFLQYSDSGDAMALRARSLAEKALQCDPLDPFAHLNLGRSLWLERALPESIERLAYCTQLSPNYAQAIYSRAWAEMTQCDVVSSDGNAEQALRLSPLDPLRYAMLAVRSVSALMRGDHSGAVDWGERAARSPGAHKHIAVIAALANQAAGDAPRAAQWAERARQLDPGVSQAGFLRSFPFAATSGRETIERTLRAVQL